MQKSKNSKKSIKISVNRVHVKFQKQDLDNKLFYAPKRCTSFVPTKSGCLFKEAFVYLVGGYRFVRMVALKSFICPHTKLLVRKGDISGIYTEDVLKCSNIRVKNRNEKTFVNNKNPKHWIPYDSACSKLKKDRIYIRFNIGFPIETCLPLVVKSFKI